MKESDPLLRFDDVSKRLGRRGEGLRLDGVSFELSSGHTLGLAGPNGSGKSTLLRLAAGMIRPSSGCVRIRGHDPFFNVSARRQLGVLVGHVRLYAHLSAAEHLRTFGNYAGASSDADLVSSMLLRVGIDTDRRIQTFSQGMRTRVALAQAFLGWPALVLLDEPSASLDAEGSDVLRELSGEATQNHGSSILIAEHAIGLLSALCNRVLVLERGQVAGERQVEVFALSVAAPEAALVLLEGRGYIGQVVQGALLLAGDRQEIMATLEQHRFFASDLEAQDFDFEPLMKRLTAHGAARHRE